MIDAETRHINSLIDHALVSLRQGLADDALGYIRQALAHEKQILNLHYIHALCLLQKGMLPEAVEALKAELLIYPNEEDARRLLRFLSEEQRPEAAAGPEIPEEPSLDSISPEEILPIHFFTIVLNGMPFLRHHIDVFEKLAVPWHWHIIEGVASLSHDTAWAVKFGGAVTEAIHRNGLSIDGTSDYIDELKQRYPDRVHVYRKNPGEFWDGKLEMVNAPLAAIQQESILWEIDADEIWTREQIEKGYSLFAANPDRTAAFYFCHYFVGPELLIISRNTYGNNSGYEWMRTWRFRPGMQWRCHEPPALCMQAADGEWLDIARMNPFTHAETEAQGLVFQHLAYVTESQLSFKEVYYGYKSAVEQWEQLNEVEEFPVLLRNYFPWVNDNALVNIAAFLNVRPQFLRSAGGDWTFFPEQVPVDWPREIGLILPGAADECALVKFMLEPLREKFPYSRITVICQDETAALFREHPCVNRIFPFEMNLALYNQPYLNKLVAKLQKLGIDMALNPAYSSTLLHHLLAFATGASTKCALEGTKGGAEVLQSYTQLMPTSAGGSEMDHYRDFLGGLGIEV